MKIIGRQLLETREKERKKETKLHIGGRARMVQSKRELDKLPAVPSVSAGTASEKSNTR